MNLINVNLNLNIDANEITKPIATYIKKAANALGTSYQPTRNVNDTDEAQQQIAKELDDTELETLKSLLDQARREQKNISDIFKKSVKVLNAKANPEDIDTEELEEDWIAYCFEHCRTVSDEEMQNLWAELLSGKASNPKTFSKRTVNLVSKLEKREAQLFNQFCQFCWMVEGEITPLIYNPKAQIYNRRDINFDHLKYL